MSATNYDPEQLHGVAIIGMSGRFPGAKNVEQFWENLANQVDCISRFKAEELEHTILSAETKARGKTSVSARGVLEDVDQFDAAFFGIYPKEAEIIDPQHRVFLECCWEALESAGYDSQRYPGMIGVFAGTSLNTYLLYNLGSDGKFGQKLASNYQVGEYQAMLGNDKDFMPTRVSYKLNLRGPSMAIQTACSSSLVAISQACSSLMSYQSDMILAGGVSITFPQRRDYLYEEEGLASVDGTCRTFDAEAKGTVFGHGCAVVLLKRLADAVQDGDNILAVIKGTAINNDGNEKIGYAAPSVNAQAEVIAMAQAAADVTPESISYIEAHGTGTPLGDPIEIAALTKAFRDGGATKNGFCAIATGKPNIGHLDVAAGATGLIKTVLQLQKGKIPPLRNYISSNPQIDFANSPFYPVTQLQNWERGSTPRRAGISAFGVGGTNAHIVVEEPPVRVRLPKDASKDQPEVHLFPLSAKSESALSAMRHNLAERLAKDEHLDLADVAFTLQQGRKSFGYRSVTAASNREQLMNALYAEHEMSNRKAAATETKVVFMFPGQGSQYVDMGKELYESEQVFRREVDRCAEILRGHLGQDIRDVLYPKEEAARTEAEKLIHETAITQPAIFTVEFALAKLWQSWGIQPNVLIGHSIGEYVCAVLAGTFTLEDALALLATRAKLMASLPSGSMLGVRLGAKDIEPMLPSDISIAAANSSKLSTLSGPTDKLTAFKAELESKKVACRMLPTSHAFHSAMMDPMLPDFLQASQRTKRHAPRVRWISTCTGEEMTNVDTDDAGYWSRQLRQSVCFADALQTLLGRGGDFVLIEVGPGSALSQFVRQHPAKTNDTGIVASLGQPENGDGDRISILSALGKVWIEGVEPNWSVFHEGQQRFRVALPTYPFERKSFWVEPQKSRDLTAEPDNAAPDLAAHDLAAESQESESCLPVVSVTSDNSDTQPEDDETATSNRIVESRKDRIASELRKIFLTLSGTAIEDDNAAFLDLGFDSLFLSQASQAIDARFKIKITFRQLLGDLSTIAAISSLLDSKLPSEAFAEVERPKTATKNKSAISLLPANATVSNAINSANVLAVGQGDIEQLLTGHIQNLKALIELNRQRTPTDANQALSSLRTVRKPSGATDVSAAGTGKKEESKRFGPYKPIEKGEKGGLTPTQEESLNRLIERYVAKTPSSKRYTAEHRPHFADPRAVAGFRSQWKEMVYPIVSARSKGSKIWDTDGNEYIDITMGFGTYFFGHSPDWLIAAIQEQLNIGIEIGPQSPLAGKVAKMISELTDLERVTFCNTGSEAVMAAMRLARTVTGRNRIVYFSGDYHGMFEEVLVRGAWPNGEYRAQPIAPGIPPSLVENILVLEYGAPESLEIIRQHADEIAAVMVEPVQSRNPSLQPREFLHQLRSITEETGSALIFDEVVTGFRCHQGGAQAYFGVKADMATYGKVVGGGMPIGILAGSPRFMDALDGGAWQYGDDSFPEVGVTFFAGTFVRHPLVIAAAHAVLNFLKESGPELQSKITSRVEHVCRSINEAMEVAQVPIRMSSFSAFAAIDYAPDLKFASLLWYYLREKGIHIWEGRPCYFTLAHTDQDLERFINTFKECVAQMQSDGFLPKQDNSTVSPSIAATPSIANTTGIAKSNDRFALSDGQREMWLGAQMSPDAARPHHACNYFILDGQFNLQAMRDAFAAVVERHVGLRCTFNADGTEVLVQPNFTLEVPLLDLSRLSDADKKIEVEKIMREEAHRLFDLSKGPLIAARVLKLEEQKHQLIVTAQMIVCDGWSHFVLFEELGEVYSAICEGREPTLQEVVPMPVYADWQQSFRGTQPDIDCENYWLSQYKTVPTPMELPTKGPRPLTRTVEADRCDLLLTNEFYNAIKQYGKSKRSSSFAVLLAAFQLWLHRLSGARDLVVGVPFSEQSSLGFHTLVGQCANTLPIRVALDPKEDFRSLLDKTWNQLLDAQENAHYSFGRLVQHLELPHDPSRIPLASVLFNVDPALTKVKFTGLKYRFSAGPRFFFQFDLGFNLVEEEEGLRIECDFNTNLFDRSIVQEWIGSYEKLLGEILTDKQIAISKLPMVDDCIGRVSEGNALPNDANVSVHQLILNQITRTPDLIAIIHGETRITYADLDRYSDHVASGIQRTQFESSKEKQSHRIGIAASNAADLVIAILATFKSGYTCVPIYPGMPADQMASVLRDSYLDSVLLSAGLSQSFNASCPVISLPEHWNAPSLDIAKPAQTDVANAQIAFVTYGAGTSGNLTNVEVTHQAMVDSIHSLRDELRVKSTDSFLGLCTWTSAVAIQNILLPLTVGARLMSVDYRALFQPETLQTEISNGTITVLQATPTVLRRRIATGWKTKSDLKILVCGEPIDEVTVDHLLTHCIELWYLYGTPDGSAWASTKRLVPDTKTALRNGTRNLNLSVVDENNQPVPKGVPGEIIVGGLRTGDYARRLSCANLELLGRKDPDLLLHGSQVDFLSIEKWLRTNHDVVDVAVVWRSDVAGKSGLIAYIFVTPETLATMDVKQRTSELRKSLRTKFIASLLPKAFVFLSEVPMDQHGVLDRTALPMPDTFGDDRIDDYVAPATQTQQKMAQIWQEILKVPSVGVDDNFFYLGGQSVQAAKLFQRIASEFGRKLPLATLFQAPTIAQISAIIDSQSIANAGWRSLVTIQPKGNKAPLFLVHGAGGNVLLYQSLAKHLAPEIPLYGLQSQGLNGDNPPLQSIEQMAELYIQEIRSVQPHGPYYLGGYCLGGTVAYEMAQRLTSEGEQVALVAMLDTYNFSRALKSSFLGFILQKLRFHIGNFMGLRPKHMMQYIKEKYRVARDGEFANLFTSRPGFEVEGAARATSGAEANVQAINDTAAEVYVPKPYAGTITLFKPRINYKFYPDPNMGWGDLAKLDIIEFSFNPHAMLLDPYVEKLAHSLIQIMSPKTMSKEFDSRPVTNEVVTTKQRRKLVKL